MHIPLPYGARPNYAAMNIHIHTTWLHTYIAFLWGDELQGHRVCIHSAFTLPVDQSRTLIYILLTVYKNFMLHSPTNYYQSGRCVVVVRHHGFNLYSSNDLQSQVTFLIFTGHLDILLVKYLFKSLTHFSIRLSFCHQSVVLLISNL